MAHPSVIKANALVFIDTAAMVALVDEGDSLSSPATALMTQCHLSKVHFFTTDFVIAEFLNFLCSVSFRQRAIGFSDVLRESDRVEIIPIDEPLFEAAYEFYRKRPDKGWSFTDCASFIVMKDRKIELAFTSDKHFEQAGFKKLLDA